MIQEHAKKLVKHVKAQTESIVHEKLQSIKTELELRRIAEDQFQRGALSYIARNQTVQDMAITEENEVEEIQLEEPI